MLLNTCLKLVLISSEVSCRISFAQTLNGSAEVAGLDLSVSTGHCLQYSIIDEDVLILWTITHADISSIIPSNMCSIDTQSARTAFWTIFILCCRRCWMTPAMSTILSFWIWSRTRSMVISVPVLPTPALHTHTHTHTLSTHESGWLVGGIYIPAVDQHRALGGSVLFLDLPVEGQDGCGIVGHSVVRPGCEVELSHFQTTLRASLQLK